MAPSLITKGGGKNVFGPPNKLSLDCIFNTFCEKSVIYNKVQE